MAILKMYICRRRAAKSGVNTEASVVLVSKRMSSNKTPTTRLRIGFLTRRDSHGTKLPLVGHN